MSATRPEVGDIVEIFGEPRIIIQDKNGVLIGVDQNFIPQAGWYVPLQNFYDSGNVKFIENIMDRY